MRASKRVKVTAEQQPLAGACQLSPPLPQLSTSSTSSPASLPSSTPLLPSPLLHSLPPAAVALLQGFLGFTLLMDLRCLSRSAARELEDAALQWMNHHLLSLSTAPASDCSPSYSAGAAERPLPFCFRHADAVWFRRQLSRWRWTCACEDAERCTISPVYDLPWSYELQRPWRWSSRQLGTQPIAATRDGWLTLSYLVQRVARLLFQRLEQGRAQGSSGLQVRAHRAVALTEKRSLRKWKAGRPLPDPLLLLLPAAVVHHSVLAFLIFEDLMDLRSVSRALRPLMETAAVDRLGRLCPSGLATIARQEGEPRRRAMQLVKEARLKAERWSVFFAKRKRGHELATLTPTAPLPVPPLSSATTSASSASPPPSDTPTSYTVAHAVWVMQQIQWSRRLLQNGKKAMRQRRDHVSPVVFRSQFRIHFSLAAEWRQRFGPSARQPIIDVLDVVLGVLGRDVGPSSLQRGRLGQGEGEQQGGVAVRLRSSCVAPASGCPERLSTDGRRRCWRCSFMYEVGQPGTAWKPRPMRFL